MQIHTLPSVLCASGKGECPERRRCCPRHQARATDWSGERWAPVGIAGHGSSVRFCWVWNTRTPKTGFSHKLHALEFYIHWKRLEKQHCTKIVAKNCVLAFCTEKVSHKRGTWCSKAKAGANYEIRTSSAAIISPREALSALLCRTFFDLFLNRVAACRETAERKLPQRLHANCLKVTSKPCCYILAAKCWHLQALLIIQDASAAVKCKGSTVLVYLVMQTRRWSTSSSSSEWCICKMNNQRTICSVKSLIGLRDWASCTWYTPEKMHTYVTIWPHVLSNWI